MLDFRH